MVQYYLLLGRYDGSIMKLSIMMLIVSEYLGPIANINIIENEYFYIYLSFSIFVSNLFHILLPQYNF